MKSILLANAYGPYDLAWGTTPTDLLNARLARGPFQIQPPKPRDAVRELLGL